MTIDPLHAGVAGLTTSSQQIAASAHNLANAITPGFRPLRTDAVSGSDGSPRVEVRPAGEAGVDLAGEIVGQLGARTRFEASLRVIEAARELRGALVDLIA